jgi:hypothetical protein
MRILLPYTVLDPRVREAVVEAVSYLDISKPRTVKIDAVDVSGPLDAYWQALAARWVPNEELVVVEHDIIPYPRFLLDFEECPEPWCAFAYDHRSGQHAPALGCTRFRPELIAANPGLIEWIGRWSDGRGAPVEDHSRPRIWQALDARLYRALSDQPLREANGFTGSWDWHVHEGAIEHLMVEHR